MRTKVAKLLTTSEGQFVCLPIEFKFEGTTVFLRRDPETGNVILSHRPHTWDGLFALYGEAEVPADFMAAADRAQSAQDRDPFAP